MKQGFTLVEVLLAMMITAILATAGITISIAAARRKAVETTTDKLVALLQLAKSNAQAGKVGSCTGGWLGWQVAINSTTALLQVVCGGATTTSTLTFPAGVTASPTTTILFKRQAAGTNLTSDVTINVRGVVTKPVTVTTKGEIQ